MLQSSILFSIKIIHTLYYRRLSGAPKRSPDLFLCLYIRGLRGVFRPDWKWCNIQKGPEEGIYKAKVVQTGKV